jgi:membrane protein YqaA with SNARE-associated domain
MVKLTFKQLFSIGIIVGVFALAFWLGKLVSGNVEIQELVSRYGYAGMFLVSAISGFNLAVPIPAISFLPVFLESGLDFAVSILVISSGMTLADLVGFYLGRTGRKVWEESSPKINMARKLERMREKHWLLPFVGVFFFAALVPFPNEILVIPLAFLGYRASYIFPAVLLGNISFNVLYSQGVLNLFKLIG